jgi:hypothetical protein
LRNGKPALVKNVLNFLPDVYIFVVHAGYFGSLFKYFYAN